MVIIVLLVQVAVQPKAIASSYRSGTAVQLAASWQLILSPARSWVTEHAQDVGALDCAAIADGAPQLRRAKDLQKTRLILAAARAFPVHRGSA